MRVTICAAVLIFGSLPSAHGQQNAPVAIPVGVVKAERGAITKTAEFVGLSAVFVDREEVPPSAGGAPQPELPAAAE